jgi:hypothetical protein
VIFAASGSWRRKDKTNLFSKMLHQKRVSEQKQSFQMNRIHFTWLTQVEDDWPCANRPRMGQERIGV